MSSVVAEERRATARVTPRYVRPADVVVMANVAKSTVFQALWAGKLRGYRLGRAWLIPIEAVDEWIRGDDQAA